MSYSDQIKSVQWQKKRLEILNRDGWKCVECKKVYRYTYKDIEKRIRIDITKNILIQFAGKAAQSLPNVMDGILIYCGKCSGFDGKGSCTRKIYNNCEIKRFPHVI